MVQFIQKSYSKISALAFSTLLNLGNFSQVLATLDQIQQPFYPIRYSFIPLLRFTNQPHALDAIKYTLNIKLELRGIKVLTWLSLAVMTD